MPRKRNTKRIFPWKILLIALPLLIFIGYFFVQEYRSGLIKYKTFGVKVPRGFELYGIDVSKYQGVINWNSVKKMDVESIKINFAFIKATQGLTSMDPKYFRNVLRARMADIPCGSYHFFLTYRDARAQANNFVRVASVKKGDLPPVVDIEEEKNIPPKKIREGLLTWLKLIENKYNVKPIIYTNAGFYKRNLAGYFDDYPLWVAHYREGDSPDTDRPWQFWQLSETAHINGISGKVDFNVFNGSEQEFAQLLIK